MTHVRAMTFNVRQMDGEDGPQVWEHRKDVLVETIRLHRPALLGTQEIFAEQSAYILRHIPTLQCFGSGRYGDSRDKHNSIFLRPGTVLSAHQRGDMDLPNTRGPGFIGLGYPQTADDHVGHASRERGERIIRNEYALPLRPRCR